MKDENFTKYFLQKLPNKVRSAAIELCDRFLEKHLKKGLSYEQYLCSFSIFKEFLDEHNVSYSIPRSLKNPKSSNYQIAEGIGEFFKEVKRNMESISSLDQFGEQPLNYLWSQKYTEQSTENLQSWDQDSLLRKIKEQDTQIQLLNHLLFKQFPEALKRAIDKPTYSYNTNKGDIMPKNNTHNDFREADVGNFANEMNDHASQQANLNITKGQEKEIKQLASDIQTLLDHLSQDSQLETPQEKLQVTEKALNHIENNDKLRPRVLKALQEGTLSALEKLLDHPAASFVTSAIKEWRKQ
jgi:hypothetical protein